MPKWSDFGNIWTTLRDVDVNAIREEAERPLSGLTPPPGLYEPSRGFGKVWREFPDIRAQIGWAVENERAVTASYQVFERGRVLRIWDDNIVWQFDIRDGARSDSVRY